MYEPYPLYFILCSIMSDGPSTADKESTTPYMRTASIESSSSVRKLKDGAMLPKKKYQRAGLFSNLYKQKQYVY